MRSERQVRLVVMAVVAAGVVGACMGASIEAFGAVAGVDSDSAAAANSAAIVAAAGAANKDAGDKTVLVPGGKTFYIFNSSMAGLTGVSFVIDGTLVLSDNIDEWGVRSGKTHIGALSVVDSSDITFTGAGLIDGRGYVWWWDTIVLGTDFRPNLVHIFTTKGVTVTNLRVQNSPQYHWNIRQVADVLIDNIWVYVDTDAVHDVLAATGNVFVVHPDHPEWDIPTFPLNTDGIDIAGINVVIQNSFIQNYDDAVAVKPTPAGGSPFSDCSQDMLIRNMTVVRGVGMTIGSVPPAHGCNCVRNITFDGVAFTEPIKAIYVKTNPGDEGTGLIDAITYRNLFIEGAFLNAMWIGPQQQHQPHQTGTGCTFFYPLNPSCPTQPRVTVSNIVLDNIVAEETYLFPGVVLCNATNPCTGFSFTNVSNTGPFDVQDTYVCIDATVAQTNVDPPLQCHTSSSAPRAPAPPADVAARFAALLAARLSARAAAGLPPVGAASATAARRWLAARG